MERSTWSILSILVKRSTGCDSFIGPAVAGTCRLGRPVSTTSRVPVGALTAVAWTELDLAGHWIARFATTWEAFQAATGKYPNRSTSHDAHDLAVGVEDASTNPRLVMAWLEDDGAGATALFVSRLEGSGWAAMDGDLANGAPSDLALALVDGQGPVVAWREPAAGGERRIFLRRWLGAAWGGLEGPMERDGGAVSSAPRLKVDPSGELVMCWSESSGGADRTFVGTWDGAAWHLTSLDGAKRPDLTFEPSGRLVLGYVDGGTEQVRAAALEGGAWIRPGPSGRFGPRGCGRDPPGDGHLGRGPVPGLEGRGRIRSGS